MFRLKQTPLLVGVGVVVVVVVVVDVVVVGALHSVSGGGPGFNVNNPLMEIAVLSVPSHLNPAIRPVPGVGPFLKHKFR